MDFREVIEIAAPPAVVWSVLQDVEHWSEWTASITSIKLVDSGPLAVGSRAEIRQPKLRPAIWQVTELEAGRNFTWSAKAPGTLVTAGHVIEPHGNGSRVELSVTFTGFLGSVMRKLMGKFTLRNMRMEANGLKARSEEMQMNSASLS